MGKRTTFGAAAAFGSATAATAQPYEPNVTTIEIEPAPERVSDDTAGPIGDLETAAGVAETAPMVVTAPAAVGQTQLGDTLSSLVVASNAYLATAAIVGLSLTILLAQGRLRVLGVGVGVVAAFVAYLGALWATPAVIETLGASVEYGSYALAATYGVSLLASFLAAQVAARWVSARGPRSEAAPERPARAASDPRRAAPRPAAASTEPADVFISYKRDERAEALAIAHRLEAMRVKVWFDAELRSGTSFDTEIDHHVRSAKCVLVCWSPAAVGSDWVRGEATIGRERGVLAAALLKDCALPAPFNLVHAEDLRPGPAPENEGWLRTLERIGGLLGRPGLAAYEKLAATPERQAYAAWLADYPEDPLFDDVAARLRTL